MQVFKNTGDTRACSGIGQYKLTKSAYTSAYVHPAASMVTSIYPSVNNTCHSVYTCMLWRTTHLCSFAPTPHCDIYTCKHASTPGTTARQQLCKELMQMQKALHVLSVRHNQPHSAHPITLSRPRAVRGCSQKTKCQCRTTWQNPTVAHCTVATACRPNMI